VQHHALHISPFALTSEERHGRKESQKAQKKNPRQHDTIFNVLIDPSREA